jgi:hypothetical protein
MLIKLPKGKSIQSLAPSIEGGWPKEGQELLMHRTAAPGSGNMVFDWIVVQRDYITGMTTRICTITRSVAHGGQWIAFAGDADATIIATGGSAIELAEEVMNAWVEQVWQV